MDALFERKGWIPTARYIPTYLPTILQYEFDDTLPLSHDELTCSTSLASGENVVLLVQGSCSQVHI